MLKLTVFEGYEVFKKRKNGSWSWPKLPNGNPDTDQLSEIELEEFGAYCAASAYTARHFGKLVKQHRDQGRQKVLEEIYKDQTFDTAELWDRRIFGADERFVRRVGEADMAKIRKLISEGKIDIQGDE